MNKEISEAVAGTKMLLIVTYVYSSSQNVEQELENVGENMKQLELSASKVRALSSLSFEGEKMEKLELQGLINI